MDCKIGEERVVWALFDGGNLLLKKDGESFRLPCGNEIQSLELVGERFEYDICETKCICSAIKPIDGERLVCQGLVFMELRTAYNYMPHEQHAMAGKGRELLYWDQYTQYCGRCGALNKRHTAISKVCSKCGHEIFPQLSPAILVLVKKGDEALLVHARDFRNPVHGLVAGFVETGESLEECVIREVREETSLEITNIRYVGSQTWPYPSNLMIGFTADYVSGEICFADHELTSGGFFKADNVPGLAPLPSLSRIMIDDWLQSLKKS